MSFRGGFWLGSEKRETHNFQPLNEWGKVDLWQKLEEQIKGKVFTVFSHLLWMRLKSLHGGCRLRAKSKGELFCHISHSHNPNGGRQRHSKIGKVMWLERVKAWVQFSSVPWTPESCGQYPEILCGPTEESWVRLAVLADVQWQCDAQRTGCWAEQYYD